MKNRVSLIILLVLCAGLAIGMVLINNHARQQAKVDAECVLTVSNNWVEATGKLEEQKQVTAMLEKDLDSQRKNFGELTNNFTKVSETLGQVSAHLEKTELVLKTTQDELTQGKAKITELETQNQALEAQNQALDKKAVDLSSAITTLNAQIDQTQKKLLASEGDKALLEQELKRMRGEKAELERQFSDLTILRAQVAKLKEEMNVARRAEWIRTGLFASSEDKGATRLIKGLTASQPKPAKPNYDLNVEISADGSVKVIPPATNRPASNAPTQ